MATELALFLLLLVPATLLGLGMNELQQSRRQVRRVLSQQIRELSQIQKRRMDLLEVRNRAKVLEGTVTGGASTIEKVHKAISGTTFGLIDLFSRDEGFRKSARRVQETHDRKTTEIYGAVKTTNRALHILADTLIISKAEKRIASRRRRPTKRP
ncbi:hypothetical protein MSNKSG1_06153 [Marinobacter santoriniensis NKSG1]|uniref:Uncharacterized protein n=1 Tax=Marinobacter santoriniensis NKSG1 TaxID=1288826 RepID=M7CTF7_9GAMM|nr:hypothetical protein [Marinobacter santoriniensis]EMP55430.1 hypothetical protein MSNKSG1_06153 [Marinobacter santoriniensis NKSG1]